MSESQAKALGQADKIFQSAENNAKSKQRIVKPTRVAGANSSRGQSSEYRLPAEANHVAVCRNAFAGSPFNVGIALDLLFLKNYELSFAVSLA